MSVLEPRVGRRLEWRQDGVLSPRFTLYDGDDTVARLRYSGWFRRQALYEAGGRGWTIGCVGLFGRHVVIEPRESERPAARFRGRWWWGGELLLAGDRELGWRRLGFPGRSWVFVQREEVVLRFDERIWWLRARAQMTVERAGDRLPELDLLAGLGWFLILRHRSRSAH